MFRKINEWIALHTITALSTMSCVYVFTIWALIPLMFPQTRDFIFYVSGGILQLSLLPAIMVGQSLLNKNSEDRAMQDHAALMETIQDLHTIMTEESDDANQLTAIHTVLQSITDLNIAQSLVQIQNRLDAIEANLVPKYQAKLN